MGRRGLHDEGSRTLLERLAGKITVDLDTARLDRGIAADLRRLADASEPAGVPAVAEGQVKTGVAPKVVVTMVAALPVPPPPASAAR